MKQTMNSEQKKMLEKRPRLFRLSYSLFWKSVSPYLRSIVSWSQWNASMMRKTTLETNLLFFFVQISLQFFWFFSQSLIDIYKLYICICVDSNEQHWNSQPLKKNLMLKKILASIFSRKDFWPGKRGIFDEYRKVFLIIVFASQTIKSCQSTDKVQFSKCCDFHL